MLKKTSIFWLFPIMALFFMVIPLNLEAREIVLGMDLKFSGETLDTNYYFAGGKINIDAEFSRDLAIAGGRVYIEGIVKEDVIVTGGEIILNNYVQGDLRVFGGTINLSSTVLGDLVVIGGEVNLTPEANILGETILIGGKLNLNTGLSNKSNIIGSSIIINSVISGNTEITTQNIVFDSGANITSNLNYFAPTKAQEMPGSKISGTVKYNQISTIRETGFVRTMIINVLSFWIILKFITTLVLAFILVLLFKVFAQEVSDVANHSFFKSFFTGILSFIAVPIVFVILMISLIGAPLGLLMVLVYILIVSLSSAFAGIIIGTMVTHVLDKNPEKKVTFPNAVIGIVLLTTVQFVPIVGDFTVLIFGLVAIGAMIRFIYRGIIKTS